MTPAEIVEGILKDRGFRPEEIKQVGWVTDYDAWRAEVWITGIEMEFYERNGHDRVASLGRIVFKAPSEGGESKTDPGVRNKDGKAKKSTKHPRNRKGKSKRQRKEST